MNHSLKNLPSDIFVLKATVTPVYSSANYSLSRSFNAMTAKTGDLYFYANPTYGSVSASTVDIVVERSLDNVNWVKVTSSSIAVTDSTALFINDIGPFTARVRAKYKVTMTGASATGDYINMNLAIIGYNN